MRIGQLSRETGVSERSIRYYERKKLLHSMRQSNGYRDYDESARERVKIIKSCLGMGFTLGEIENILACTLAGPESVPLCDTALLLYARRLQKIDEQIDILHVIRKRLHDMLLHSNLEQNVLKRLEE